MEKLNRFNRDEAVWYAHKVVCAYYDAGKKPTVGELRANWQANNYKNVTDAELQEIINKVERFYI